MSGSGVSPKRSKQNLEKKIMNRIGRKESYRFKNVVSFW
jgi:hypothetical protein